MASPWLLPVSHLPLGRWDLDDGHGVDEDQLNIADMVRRTMGMCVGRPYLLPGPASFHQRAPLLVAPLLLQRTSEGTNKPHNYPGTTIAKNIANKPNSMGHATPKNNTSGPLT